MNNKKIGNLGERIAKFYLQINKYQILKINFRYRQGEIDIIAQKNNCIHFVEVKTRTQNFMEPREAIDERKQKHIWNCAQYYIYKNKIKEKEFQFDAIEIYLLKDSLKINYIAGIIEK